MFWEQEKWELVLRRAKSSVIIGGRGKEEGHGLPKMGNHCGALRGCGAGSCVGAKTKSK